VDPSNLTHEEIESVCQASSIILRKLDKNDRAMPAPVDRPAQGVCVDKRLTLEEKRSMLLSVLLKKPAAEGRWSFRSVQQCYQHNLATHLGLARRDHEFGRSSTTEYKWIRGLLGNTGTPPVRSLGAHRKGSTVLPFKAEVMIASFLEAQLWSGKPVSRSTVRACHGAVPKRITTAYNHLGEDVPPLLVQGLERVVSSQKCLSGFLAPRRG
jgi:hypothetical protein